MDKFNMPKLLFEHDFSPLDEQDDGSQHFFLLDMFNYN